MKTLLLLITLLVTNTYVFAQNPEEDTPTPSPVIEPDYYDLACQDAEVYINDNGIHWDRKRNALLDKNGIIHIFLFENGNTIKTGFPTTATENEKYQVHLYKREGNDNTYKLEISGSYLPSFNIQNGANVEVNLEVAKQSVKKNDFSIVGPFTDNFTIILKEGSEAIVSTNIKVSRTIHASIGSGIIYSFLKDPSNIRTLPMPNGDTTLLADNPNGQAYLTICATYYPWGRNSLFMTSRLLDMRSRLGIVVGTSIGSSSSNFKNFQLGLQYDFAIGGSFIIGGNLGKQQRIQNINYKDFEFGETVFTGGNLDARMYSSWTIRPFIGIQVDSRIFGQLFRNP